MSQDGLPLEAFEAFVAEQLRLGQTPGLALSVQRGDALWQRGYGYADLERRVPMTERSGVVIGSTTKALTCVALLQLAERGALSLDDPITRYIPSFHLASVPEPAITIRQAVTHAAGLPPTRSDDPTFLCCDDAADDALARYVDTLAERTPIWPPGAGWAYANDGYTLAGRVIEVATGLAYEDYMRRYVLAPLALQETGFGREDLPDAAIATPYDYDGDGAPYPSFFPRNRASAAAGSQLIMSARDAGRWLQTALHAGEAPGGRLLSAERFAELFRPQVPLPAGVRGSDGTDRQYALGWMLGSLAGMPAIHHGGSAITMGSHFVLVPEEQLAVAVVTNSSTQATAIIAEGIVSLALGRQPVRGFPAVDPAFVPDRTRWPELVGVYQPLITQNSVPGPLPIVYEDERLRARTYPGDAQRRPGDIFMRPVGDLRFVLSGRGRTGS
ncbi:MAG TPA: serine hydrolase domain-containing protein, partial [Chloroflexota bacterium]|nr:serine hydrolase domain-containing protein [Chloroflexota bacterium]